MKKILTFVLLVMLLSGCATSPIPTEEAIFVPPERILDTRYLEQKPSAIPLVIKRDTGLNGSACSSRVFIDGLAIADLDTSEKINIFLNEGEYIISAMPKSMCAGRIAEVKVHVKIGGKLIYRIGYGTNGDFYIVPTAF